MDISRTIHELLLRKILNLYVCTCVFEEQNNTVPIIQQYYQQKHKRILKLVDTEHTYIYFFYLFIYFTYLYVSDNHVAIFREANNKGWIN